MFELRAAEAASIKLDHIRQAFEPYPHLLPHVPEDLVRVNELHYRNRARMAVRDGRPGFFVSGSREHLPIEKCAVHRPELEEILGHIRPHLLASPLREAVRFVDARVGESAVVTFVVTRDDDAIRGALEALALQQNFGVSIALSDDTGAVIPNPPEVVIEPAAAVMKAGELHLEAPPRAFYQVNDEVLERIHAAMASMLGKTPVIVDAYCGVGTHGLVLANGRRVVGFDSSAEAIGAAQRNAERNEIDAKFQVVGASDLSDWGWPEADQFATIANPARTGLTPEFVKSVADSASHQLLYLSCEPITLSRDLERLRRRGFYVAEAQAFDMMPRTEQVETLVRLERTEAPERHYEGAFDDQKQWPRGVSGPLPGATAPEATTWFARLVGKVPHGQPPSRSGNTPIEVKRVRNIGDQSVARISMQGGDAEELLRRLRDWGHPVVGDEEHGISSVNALAARNLWVDRPLVHCVRATVDGVNFDAPVPGELLPYFRLPGHKLAP